MKLVAGKNATLFVALCLIGCGDKLDPITEVADANDTTPVKTNPVESTAPTAESVNLCHTGASSITYALHAKTVFTASCSTSGCHSTAAKTSGVITDTYDGAKSAFLNRNAQDEVDTKRMPLSGSLTADQICILDNWAKNKLAP